MIKNPDVNIQRLYSPPPVPNVPLAGRSTMSIQDASGLPVLVRNNSYQSGPQRIHGDTLAAAEAAFGYNNSTA